MVGGSLLSCLSAKQSQSGKWPPFFSAVSTAGYQVFELFFTLSRHAPTRCSCYSVTTTTFRAPDFERGTELLTRLRSGANVGGKVGVPPLRRHQSFGIPFLSFLRCYYSGYGPTYYYVIWDCSSVFFSGFSLNAVVGVKY